MAPNLPALGFSLVQRAIEARNDKQTGVPYPPPPWIIVFIAVPVFAIAMGIMNATGEAIENRRSERDNSDSV